MDRVQLKRIALDKWSVREQLCLASSVFCSGDQNWMSVSRSLKMLCANRPTDWFSQKSCAVQYGELLENVETPKRKKRAGPERDSQTTETPTESVLRKLTNERVAELKKLIQQEQQEYARIKEELLAIENGTANEAQIKQMWAQIEQERIQKEQEQQKYIQWLKEREERKIEMQRSARPAGSQSQPGTPTGGSPVHNKPSFINLKKNYDDMETEEASSKQGASPLLTSLLKSPSNTSSSIVSVHTTVTNSSPSNVRSTAPTITNLLTGVTAAQALANTCTTQASHSITSQPLTGPVPTEATPQIVRTPSQSAPTISMLLESKISRKTSSEPEKDQLQIEVKPEPITPQTEPMDTEEAHGSPSKEEEEQLMEVFNTLIPDNVDLDEILTNNNAMILNADLLEEDAILKNVESLMEVDFDEKSNSPKSDIKSQESDSKNAIESLPVIKPKDEEKTENDNALDPNIKVKLEDSSGGPSADIKPLIDNSIEGNEKTDIKPKESNCSEEPVILDEKIKYKEEPPNNSEQIQVIDDSSEETCVQEVGENCEGESRNPSELQTKQTNSEKITKSNTDFDSAFRHSIETKDSQSESVVTTENKTTDDEKQKQTKVSEVVEIKEDESNDSKANIEKLEELNETPMEDIKSEESVSVETKKVDEAKKQSQSQFPNTIDKEEDSSISDSKMSEDNTSADKSTKVTIDLGQFLSERSATITIIDTDDDSPIEVIKEDKIGKTKRDYSRRKIDTPAEKKVEEGSDDNRSNLSVRRLKERDGSESPLVDDDNTDSIPRTRRRYSSTPVIDSIPNSPASSDDREYKAWKRSVLTVYNRLCNSKNASMFLRSISEDQAHNYNYKLAILRPMDLQIIKRNIDSGAIRTTAEFQRDVMLICCNAYMYSKKHDTVRHVARDLAAECAQLIETIIDGAKKDSDRSQGSSSTTKSRSRKSTRIT